MSKEIAIYARVSTRKQTLAAQEPDLKRWAAAQDERVVWYRECASGLKMERPEWERLEAAILRNEVSCVAVWRIDRLGRTAKGLTALFDLLRERGVNLVSLKDGIDLSTTGGRLVATVLAGVAQYESEVRGERVIAGMAAAQANGKTWAGRRAGMRLKVTPAVERVILEMAGRNEPITVIASTLKLSRPTIYDVLNAKKVVTP